MQLTQEQHNIINSVFNIKINAVAGSGKTTTVIEYAKTRPKGSKILYLAFNKVVKTEAIKKFADKGLHNVKVETAHSLAYKHIVYQNGYNVQANGYKTYEIAEILGLQGNGEKHAEYIVANHINKFIAYFCNSDKLKVQDLNYLDVVSDSKAKVFVATFYDHIVRFARVFLSKMDKGEIEITHDFYLKKFQLSNPKLDFDYILFDEGQDASPAMLDVFFKQKATKVIVGDTHQQIYGWRFAVNSLEKANYKTYNLSTSFRFSQDIANLAMESLKLKKQLGEYTPLAITGMGTSKTLKTKAALGRTNLGLLLKAIEYVTEKGKLKHLYFEGNFNSYTYADDGASLYDVLHLYNGKRRLIKDKLIKEMKDLDELEDYIKKTEDVQLGMMVEIVREYGNEIPEIIKTIKERHVADDEKDKAQIIFSTVHRCKGMEYDVIELVDDFINEEKLEKIKKDYKPEEINVAKLNEEINLLYVAVTRAKNIIHIPQTLMPKEFPVSPQIVITHVKAEEENKEKGTNKNTKAPIQKTTYTAKADEKANIVKEPIGKYQKTSKAWTRELDEELTKMYIDGGSPKDIAKHFGRTTGAIISRVKKLELEQIY